MSIDPTQIPSNGTERQQAETANGSDSGAQAAPGLEAGLSSEPVAASSSSQGPSTTPLAVAEAPASTST
ncbi:MAG: hypothetical protein M3437_13925, partial [Chloroflexota bacterium]|nr:hypothetical protein [Chloroflexota bacterium]